MSGIEFETPSPALKPRTNQLIKDLWIQIQCTQIAPDSRRARSMQEAIDSLRILRSSLESLSQAERFEQEEKRRKLVDMPTMRVPAQKKTA